ncbi:MAG: LysR family transcriptional regulator [Acidobacteriota bacterium]
MIDLHALRVFKAIVDHRGFARGAEASFLTQSAASQALRRLEDDLGTASCAGARRRSRRRGARLRARRGRAGARSMRRAATWRR